MVKPECNGGGPRPGGRRCAGRVGRSGARLDTYCIVARILSLPIGNCFLMTFTPGIPTSRLALEGNPPEPNLVENVVNMLKRGRSPCLCHGNSKSLNLTRFPTPVKFFIFTGLRMNTLSLALLLTIGISVRTPPLWNVKCRSNVGHSSSHATSLGRIRCYFGGGWGGV